MGKITNQYVCTPEWRKMDVFFEDVFFEKKNLHMCPSLLINRGRHTWNVDFYFFKKVKK